MKSYGWYSTMRLSSSNIDVPKTGNGNEEQGTGKREQGAGNGERETGNGKRGAGNDHPQTLHFAFVKKNWWHNKFLGA